MASNKTERTLESMLKCCICQDILQDPKTLSCFHSFCQKCIKQLPEETHENSTGLKCPVCRAFTPDNIVKANFLVNELLEMHNSKQSGIAQPCDQCSKKKPSWKCVDCKITLCKECKTIHLKIPLLRGHRVVSNDADTDMMCDRLVFCMKHTDQPIIFNCSDCEVPLCIKCKVTQHESHKTETIEDTLERILPEVGTCVDKVKEHIADIGDNDEYLKTKMADIKEKFNQCRKESKDNLQKVITNATEHHKQVVKALDIKEDEELGKLEAWVNRKTEYEQLVEWVSTCNQAAKGVSLMGEIQTGLFGRLKEISSSKKMTEAAVMIDYPELKPDHVKDKMENLTGKVTYKPAKLFKSTFVDGRAPSVPYAQIFSRQLVSQKEIVLKAQCNRISIIEGNIWAPVPANNTIQVFDLDGNELASIQFNNGPRSVKQLPNGEIIVASDSGLFSVNPDGTRGPQVQGTTGTFSDFFVQGDHMVAINYSLNKAVYCIKSEDTWSQQGALQCRYWTNSPNDTVLMQKETFLTHHSHASNVISQYNDQFACVAISKSNSHVMSRPFLVGADSTGNILIVDKSRFQLFNPTNNQWHLVSNVLVPHGSNATDLLYVDGSVWILSCHPRNRLVKYK